MRAVNTEQLEHGACLDLPLAVVDKYFLADPNTEYFQYLTAKAICGQCAVRAACLLDAITLPSPSVGVRGGESARAIRRLHERYLDGDNAEALVTAALLAQRHARTVANSSGLRAGRFDDVPLIED